jgi:hypothetical protein
VRRDILLKAGYLVALLLVLMPLWDILARNWPIQPGNERWRFATLGPAFNAMVTPLLGVFLAMVLAVLLDHRRTLKTLGAVTIAAAVGSLAALGLFTLDYLQLRASVTAEAIAMWDAAGRKAIAVGVLGTVATLVLGISGWRAAGRVSRSRDGVTSMSGWSFPRGRRRDEGNSVCDCGAAHAGRSGAHADAGTGTARHVTLRDGRPRVGQVPEL